MRWPWSKVKVKKTTVCACRADIAFSVMDLNTEYPNLRQLVTTVTHAEPLCDEWKSGKLDLVGAFKGA